MPDFLDRVQDRVQADTDAAIAAHRAGAVVPGRYCACGCGAEVEPERRAIGACRTLECQRAHEARERQYGGR